MRALLKQVHRDELDGLPLTWANYDEMDKLYQAWEGLVAGLIVAVNREEDVRDVAAITTGLEALESAFINVGVDGAPAARRWLQAASALVTAGERLPDEHEEATR